MQFDARGIPNTAQEGDLLQYPNDTYNVYVLYASAPRISRLTALEMNETGYVRILTRDQCKPSC